MLKRLKKAFTITELVIVIAVIAILAAVLIPTFANVISNSKKSAALQTCSNALKDYSSTAIVNDTELDGVVFVSDGYAYVYLNSSLQYIGETSGLVKVDASGKFSSTTIKNATVSDTINSTAAYTQVVITTSGNDIETKSVTINVADLAAGATNNANKKAENLYFYSIEVNKTNYVGYFTLEGDSAAYQTEGATYSRLFGFANVDSYSVAISDTVPTTTTPDTDDEQQGTGTDDEQQGTGTDDEQQGNG